MNPHRSLHVPGLALALSAGLLAGCAAPVVTAPATVPAPTAPAAGAAPAAEAPAAPQAAAPAPAAAAATPLTGTATFRGEALSGYALRVLDARTGEPVALSADLATATGLAVLDRNLTTDAQGRFSLQVAGLGEGQALRVQVSKNDTMLETIVTGDGQPLGAPAGYRALATASLSITELSTAIAAVAKSVLLTTQFLPAKAAAPIVAKLAVQMTTLSTQLSSALTINPGLANGVVKPGKDGDAAIKTLVTNANALQSLTASIADLVAEIAKSAKANPAANARLSSLVFVGTVLTGDFDGNAFSLTNTVNGQRVDAGSGNLGTVTTKVTSNSGGHSGGPAEVIRNVANAEELILALDDATVDHIVLTADITLPAPQAYRVLDLEPIVEVPSTLSIERAVTLDGGAAKHHLNTWGYNKVLATGVTLKNLTLNNGFQEDNYAAFNHVTLNTTFDGDVFNLEEGGQAVIITTLGKTTVRNCTFNGGFLGLNLGEGDVQGCEFVGCYGGLMVRKPSVIKTNTFDLPDSRDGYNPAAGVSFSDNMYQTAWTAANVANVKSNAFSRQSDGQSPYAFYVQPGLANPNDSMSLQGALRSDTAGNDFGDVASEFHVFTQLAE